jgi:hypothetical protein
MYAEAIIVYIVTLFFLTESEVAAADASVEGESVGTAKGVRLGKGEKKKRPVKTTS